MKHIFIIIFGLFLLTTCVIRQEENPTIFEGKIVYEDDGSPAAGADIGIGSSLRTPAFGGASGPSQGATVDETGTFRIEFAPNEDISSFSITAGFATSDGTIIVIYSPANGLDCSPFSCSNFQPGRAYTDLVLKIPRL